MKDVSRYRLIEGLSVFCGLILLLAILPVSYYGFYVLLRWIVCLISVFTAYSFFQNKRFGWIYIFGAVAFMFNPLIPLYLSKDSWIVIDFLSAILFFIASTQYKKVDITK